MREQAAETANDLFVTDPRVAVVLSEISVGLFQPSLDHDPARAVNVGIMEQTVVGVSAGLAMEGFRPIAHTITPFLVERPLEQLKVDFGYQGLGGTFVSVGASYDYSAEGATHHSPGDVQVLSSIPGMQILIPGAPSEVDLLLRQTYANDQPTYLRTVAASNAQGLEVELGRIEVLKRGSAGTVIAFGPMLDRTAAAVADMDVSLLYATSVEPFDGATLTAVAGDHPVVITVEPFYEGSVSSRIAEALRHVPSRIGSVGVPRAFITRYGTATEIDRSLHLDEAGIREQIVRFLEGR
jgi:transketolase